MAVSDFSHLIGTSSHFYSVKDRKKVRGTINRITRHRLRNKRYSYVARGTDAQNRPVTKIIANELS